MPGIRRITSWGPSKLPRRLIHRPRPRRRFYANCVRAAFASSDMQLEKGEHKYDCINTCIWGMGLMRARRHVHRLVDFMSTLQGTKPKTVVGNPCLAKGTRRVVNVKDELTGVERKATVDGEDIGSFEACDRVVQLVLAKDAYVRFSSFLSPFFSSFFSLPFLSLLLVSILPLFFPSPHPSLLSPPSSLPPFFPVPALFFPSPNKTSLPLHMLTEYVNSNHAPSMASTNPPSSLPSPTVKSSSSSSTSTTASSPSSCPPPP